MSLVISHASAATRSTRVLHVEDDADDALLVREVLTAAAEQEFSVMQAGSLISALELLKSSAIDVILLDLTLPDSSGLDTFRRMAAAAPDIPIVVLSGWDDRRTAMMAVQHGAQDYLSKADIEQRILQRVLTHAIKRQALVREVRASERRTRRIITHDPDAIVIVDGKGVIRYGNPAAEALFEVSRGGLAERAFPYPVPAVEACIEIGRANGQRVQAQVHPAQDRVAG